MNVAILTVGTQGDVQPYIALGLGMKEAGHEVTFVTGKGFESSVSERGLDHFALDVDLLELAQSPEGKAALAGKNLFSTIKKLVPTMRRMLDDEWKAIRGADALIYHPKALGGYHIAEALGVPSFMAHPVPAFSPTRAFPIPVLPIPDLGGLFNKMSYGALLRLITAPYHRTINRWRSESLDLPPRRFMASELELRGEPIRRLYCYSPHVVPTPADWDASSTTTGYWFLNHQEGWRPPALLSEFLAVGPPPVYVGFGPTAGDPERSHAVAVAALRESGQRGVLATGHAGLPHSVTDGVCVVESVPHDWLFPRMAAVVHHGGAGTTAEGLRAGKPTVVCPSFGDQPFWGRRVYELGAGPRPVPQKRLTIERLSNAIHTVTMNVAVRRRATELGEMIRTENGVARAVEIIDARLSKSISKPPPPSAPSGSS